MANYPEKLYLLLSDLKLIDDRDELGDLLIECASRFTDVPTSIATRPFPSSNKVPGCESEAYVWAKNDPNLGIKFYFAVENPHGISAKALSVILDETLSGLIPEEIALVKEEIVYDIFGPQITMGRGQGLMSMVAMAKALAKRG